MPWLWPSLLTLLLGWYQVGRPELWRDELWSWSFAAEPAHALVAEASKSNPAELPYDLVLHYWMAVFGDSVLAMRMLSVLAMAGAAACVTLAGRRLAGARAGLLAGLVFALLPGVSRYAQEVRFYALEVLAVTLATLLLLRALDAPSVRRWAAYGACLAVVGYIDLVALSVLAGHAAAAALRWWQDREGRRLLGFAAAAVAGLAICAPLAAASVGKSGTQVYWIRRPGLNLYAFETFTRNPFLSTSVAVAVIVLGFLAWAVDWQAAAFATAVAVLPTAAVWLLSQGPHSYFYYRYLLFTVGAWAILAGIGLSRIDVRVAAVAVLVVGVLGVGSQKAIRKPGGHTHVDYAGAAKIIAHTVRAGDGIIYPDRCTWKMIGPGLQYYLQQDMPHGVPVLRDLFVPTTYQRIQIRPPGCRRPAAFLAGEPRIWLIGSGRQKDPYSAVPAGQAAAVRSRYRLAHIRYVRGLTVSLLVRNGHLTG